MSHIFIVPSGIKVTPSIVGIGFTDELELSCFGPCKREGYTIHFNAKGKGYFNGMPIYAGQGFLVPDGMYAHHFADKDDPWELLWITFHEKDSESEKIFSEYNADPKTNIFDFHTPLYVNETIKKLKEQSGISMNSLKLLEMYLKIHCNCLALPPDTDKASDIYIDYAVKYIKNNIYRPVSVKELTELIGITQPYLYRLFIEKFAVSPKQYILDSKLSIAKDMLLNTDMTVTEIANSVGYSDILTFSRFFSTKENMSPTKYREFHRK